MSTYDVAIVGAGPAGLAAACAAVATGVRTVVVDDGTEPGGELVRRPDVRVSVRSWASDVCVVGDDHPGPELAALLAAQASAAGATLRQSSTAWGVFPGSVLHVSTPEGTDDEVQARCIILATGATDAPLPFPGWTTPGVITASAARTLLHRHGILPGQRALVVGSSPDAIAISLDVAAAGAAVVAVVEAWDTPLASDVSLASLRQRGIPLWTGTTITGLEATDGVQAVTLASGSTSAKTLIDVVIIAAGAVAETTLARLIGAATSTDATGGTVIVHDETMRATGADVYVAGRVAGAPSIEAALTQGALAGVHAAAASVDVAPAAEMVARYRRACDEALRKGAAAWSDMAAQAHPLLRFLPTSGGDEIVICRCEDLHLDDVRAVLAAGARTQDAVKRRTRAGMGLCQGRYCGAVINAIIARETGRSFDGLESMTARGPARPILLSTLVGPFRLLAQPDES